MILQIDIEYFFKVLLIIEDYVYMYYQLEILIQIIFLHV